MVEFVSDENNPANDEEEERDVGKGPVEEPWEGFLSSGHDPGCIPLVAMELLHFGSHSFNELDRTRPTPYHSHDLVLPFQRAVPGSRVDHWPLEGLELFRNIRDPEGTRSVDSKSMEA